MNVPEIVDGLDEFNFDVPLDARHVPAAYDLADYVASAGIRKNDRLTDGQITRAAKDSPVIKHNDGSAVLADRLERTARFRWQAPDRYADF